MSDLKSKIQIGNWKELAIEMDIYVKSVRLKDGTTEITQFQDPPPFHIYYGEIVEVGENESWWVISTLFSPSEDFKYPVRRLTYEKAYKNKRAIQKNFKQEDFDEFRLNKKRIRVEKPTVHTRQALFLLWQNRGKKFSGPEI